MSATIRRRSEFIWTPDQAIAADVSFREMIGNGPVRRDDGQNRWYYFRKSFQLSDSPPDAKIDITVDGRYVAYLNGQQVGRGPARSAPYYQRVDRYDVTSMLQTGDNSIAVLVHVYGIDTAWYETVKDYWQTLFGDGGLYCVCHSDTAGVLARSDTSWRCREAIAWNRDTPKSGWGQGFIEDYDARKAPQNWVERDFDDSDWMPAQVLLDRRDDDDRAKGFGPIRAFPTLLLNDMSPLVEIPLAPESIVSCYGVQPDPTLPLDQRLYGEHLHECPQGRVENPNALLTDDESATVLCTTTEQDVCLLLRFEDLHSGYPFIEFEASGDEIIEVAVAETYPGEFDTASSESPRLARQTFLDCAQLFRLTARPGQQRFTKFEWTAIRYLQLVVRNAPAGIKIRQVGSIATHYDVENQGEFHCSDSALNRLWRVARHTVLQCSHDAWEDCPGREKRQWVGDGVARYPVAAAAFGTSIQALDRRFLLSCIESQRSDGLLQMYAPGDHKTWGVVIPDYGLHYILIAHDYLMHTNDLDTLEAILPGMQRILAWFERHVGANHLLDNIPYWHFIEWANVGREGESACINALYVAALTRAGDIADHLDYGRLAKRYRQQADQISDAINERLWDTDRNVYADNIAPHNVQTSARVSQQANALILLFDIAPPHRRDAIIAYVTDRKRLKLTAVPPVVPSGQPFDTKHDVVRCNTFFSHFLYSALARNGRFDLTLESIREHFGPMLATGTSTLWESFDPSASLCHAFSATPLYQLSANLLGVRPTAPGFGEFLVAPQFHDIESANGLYPTPAGPIAVDWVRRGDVVEFTIDVPRGINGKFVVPDGFHLTQGETRLATNANQLVVAKDNNNG